MSTDACQVAIQAVDPLSISHRLGSQAGAAADSFEAAADLSH